MGSSVGAHRLFGGTDPFFETSFAPAAIDFRRMHERANIHWMSLLRGRTMPSVNDLDLAASDDLAQHMVILDLADGHETPSIKHIGAALGAECGISPGNGPTAVARDSLLHRLLHHFMFTLLSSRNPVSFEAEHMSSSNDRPTLYRGILLPLSVDERQIDHVYGVINWRHLAGFDTSHWNATPGGVWRISG